jgi:hypothetical protein
MSGKHHVPRKYIDAAVVDVLANRFFINGVYPPRGNELSPVVGKEPILNCWVAINPNGMVCVFDTEPQAGKHSFKHTGRYYRCIDVLTLREENDISGLWQSHKEPLAEHITAYLTKSAEEFVARIDAFGRGEA